MKKRSLTFVYATKNYTNRTIDSTRIFIEHLEGQRTISAEEEPSIVLPTSFLKLNGYGSMSVLNTMKGIPYIVRGGAVDAKLDDSESY